MSRIDYFEILKEDIYGNVATVFHRGNKDKLNHLLNKTYVNKSHIDFSSYNKALYTTFNMSSQLNTNSRHQGNDMKKVYGDYIIKLAVKGLNNFWFCNFDLYKKYINSNAKPTTWIDEQLKKFNINYKRDFFFSSNIYQTANHTKISAFFERSDAIPNRIKGIVYKGDYDGDCILIYDWTTTVPISISSDEGKTWEKVDKNKTTDFRKNFKNNDYIDTSKQTKMPKFKIKGKDIDVEEEAVNLQGAPKEVGGDFDCSDTKITSLQGAPEKVGGGFYCYNTKITREQAIEYLKNNDCEEIVDVFGKITKSDVIKESFKYFNY